MIGHHYVNQVLSADHLQHLRSEADLFRASQAKEAQTLLRRRAAKPSLGVRLARRLAHARSAQSQAQQSPVATAAATTPAT